MHSSDIEDIENIEKGATNGPAQQPSQEHLSQTNDFLPSYEDELNRNMRTFGPPDPQYGKWYPFEHIQEPVQRKQRKPWWFWATLVAVLLSCLILASVLVWHYESVKPTKGSAQTRSEPTTIIETLTRTVYVTQKSQLDSTQIVMQTVEPTRLVTLTSTTTPSKLSTSITIVDPLIDTTASSTSSQIIATSYTPDGAEHSSLSSDMISKPVSLSTSTPSSSVSAVTEMVDSRSPTVVLPAPSTPVKILSYTVDRCGVPGEACG